MGEISEAPLFVDDTPNMNLMEIRAKARRLKQRHDLKLIVVDYLQLMSSPKRTESRQQEVAELSRGLKLLAKEVECPVVAVSQLNRGPEQRTDKRPQLADLRESGCMTADTTLLRADTGAPVTFSALLRDGFDGISVWSLDEDRRMVARPIVNVFPSGTKTVYRLNLASGRTVKASGNHRFATPGGWTELDALRRGDRVAVPSRTPAPINAGLGWSPDRIGLLAHLISDRCVPGSRSLHYTSSDEASLSFVATAGAAEFGLTAHRGGDGERHRMYLPVPYRLTRWFSDLGIDGRRSDERRLPDALYAADDEEIRLFLRHLWAAAGRVFAPEPATGSVGRIYYATSSRALADGVAHLLNRLGIATRIQRVSRDNPDRPGYRVSVAGGTDMRRFCAEVRAYGSGGRRVAADLTRAATVMDSDHQRATDDVSWDHVASVEEIGELPVYDATVKGTHNFIADGIVAHNSIEQDADVVILLHRDDYYDKESPRAGEADFIVAKHRNGPTDTVTVAAQLHLSRFVDMAL
jgi:replicative DNA helicase